MYKRILVPVDGSETSLAGLREAIALSKSHGSKLLLLHIINEMPLSESEAALPLQEIMVALRREGKEILDEAQGIVREHALQPEVVLIEALGGRAADKIAEQAHAWPADIIVMGTHGRSGIRRLVLGSNAEHVLRTAKLPILLVPG